MRVVIVHVPPLTSVALQNNKTMTTESDKLEYVIISFKLHIKKWKEPGHVRTFAVSTKGGQTLLQALQRCQKTNPNKFSFHTKDVPTSGPYVVEVMWDGKTVENGKNTFWETLLYDDGNEDVKPISLYHRVCDGDNVFLKFSHLKDAA